MTSGSEPSPEFSRLLRDALLHLNSPTHLTGHALNDVLRPLLNRGTDQAQGLREVLIDALEALEPHGGASADDAVRRPYLVLVYRCLDGFSVEEVSRRLHVGTRQCRRDLHAGLAAVAAVVWGRLQQSSEASGRADAAVDSAVSAELAALGVTLEHASLAGLCDSLRPSLAAIGEMYGTPIELQLQPDAGVLCDPMLTKQALLSCLTVLADQAADAPRPEPSLVVQTLAGGPEAAEHAAAGLRPEALLVLQTHAGEPQVAVAIRPPLAADAVADLRADLSEAMELLACQGATLRLTLAEDGGCTGLVLAFPAQAARTVLVVDDNDGMRQLYERYLSEGRYQVALAGSAAEAETMLQARRPDAIVLDVMMRGVDGWELLQRLKSRPELAGVPVIVCSVLKEPGLALALGARAYLKKPITAEALVACLGDVLAASSPGEPPTRSR